MKPGGVVNILDQIELPSLAEVRKARIAKTAEKVNDSSAGIEQPPISVNNSSAINQDIFETEFDMN